MSAVEISPARSRALPVPLPRPADGATASLAADTAALMLALALPTVAAMAFDGRLLDGVGVWVKPLKFELSLALHFATLAVLLALVRPEVRDGWWLRGWMIAAAASAIGEMAYIGAQAARGRASHFNDDSPFEAMAYSAMGIGAVILLAVAAVLAVSIARSAVAGSGRGLRAGAVSGLALGAVSTLVVAGAMGSQEITAYGHAVGQLTGPDGSLPLVGWSTVRGDLRVPHFFATHTMQVFPVAGWLADRYRPGRAMQLTMAVAGLWLAVILATFMQALAGQPLLPLG